MKTTMTTIIDYRFMSKSNYSVIVQFIAVYDLSMKSLKFRQFQF